MSKESTCVLTQHWDSTAVLFTKGYFNFFFCHTGSLTWGDELFYPLFSLCQDTCSFCLLSIFQRLQESLYYAFLN